MNDDLMGQFARMQSYAAALHEVISTAQRLAPRQSTGADRTGVVRVELGADGLPTLFRVGRDWDRRLRPGGFAGAVVEAVRAALADRMEEWSLSLADAGWQDGLDLLVAGPRDLADDPTPATIRAPVEGASPRPLDDLAEDLFTVLGRAGANALPRESRVTGADDSGKVTITLAPTGMTGCTAEERWVAGQTAPRLTHALGAALRSARAELAAAAEPSTTGRMDRLFAEAMAVLTDPNRLSD